MANFIGMVHVASILTLLDQWPAIGGCRASNLVRCPTAMGRSRTADPPNSPPQTSTSLLRQEHFECKMVA
jgi:hypothetical protein